MTFRGPSAGTAIYRTESPGPFTNLLTTGRSRVRLKINKFSNHIQFAAS